MAYELWKATFRVGTRVKVISQRKYPNEKLLGLVGTVRSDAGSNVAVVLDDIANVRSSYGCFYFKPVELLALDEFVDENVKEHNMNKITNYLNVARVRMYNDRKDGVYQYANFDLDLKADDFCVVRTEDDRFLVAKVVEIVDNPNLEMYREVVSKVYIDDYNSRLECRAKAAELKAKLEARAKQLQDIALYQMLAKDDPDMRELLNEYQSISKASGSRYEWVSM